MVVGEAPLGNVGGDTAVMVVDSAMAGRAEWIVVRLMRSVDCSGLPARS